VNLPTTNRLPVLLVALALLAATVFAYWTVHENGFVGYDDPRYVADNKLVQRGLTGEGIGWAFRTGSGGNWHPLTWMTHMLDSELWGTWPGGHHVTNVVLHALSTLLLFGFLWRTTGAVGASGFVAGAFALHPLHVESVAWAAERKDTLSTLFWMTTLWAWWWYAARPGVLRYLLVGVSLALGLMSKAMLVTMPFVLLLLDYWPLDRLRAASPARSTAPPARPGRKGRPAPPPPAPPGLRPVMLRLVGEKLPLLLLVVVASAIAVTMQRAAGAVQSTDTIPIDLRLRNAIISYVAYLGKTVWPTHLAVFYPYDRSLPVAEVLGALLLLIAVSVLAVREAGRRPWLPVGWFWYLGTLVPVIGLIQVGAQGLADRYTYVPLTGIFIIVAWTGAELTRGRTARVATGAAAVATLVVWAALSREQVRYWRNSVTLYEHAIAVTSGNYMMHYNLGKELQDLRRIDDAIPHYEAAARFNRQFAPPHNNLGVVYAERGRNAEAIEHYTEAIRIHPRDAEAHNNLGNVLSNAGRGAEAVEHFATATRLKPDYVAAYSNAALSLLRLGRDEEAATQARAALRLNPRFAQAHNMLGTALAKLGKPRDAIAAYREALRLSPGWPPAQRRLAWLLATYPDASVRDASEALRLVRDANQRTGDRDPEMLDTLAAAAAEAGRFDEAIGAAERALAAIGPAARPGLAAEITARLAGYRAGRPARDPAAG
jgi:protein O-mannosyl-transferase